MGKVNDQYSGFLSEQRYTHFFTLTTEYELTLKSSRRLAERTFCNWSKVVNDLTGFWVCERFKEKPGYHIHGLISLPRKWTLKEDFRTLLRCYQKATGRMKHERWQRIDLRRIKSRSSESLDYVAKYVSKSTKVDYDFHTESMNNGQRVIHE